MDRRITLGCLLLLAAATNGLAAVANVNVGPFGGDWDWEDKPLKGRVERYRLARETKGPDGKPVPSESGHNHVFVDVEGGGREEHVDSHTVITYDAQGRRSRIVRQFSENGPNNSITATETATRDPQGRITRIDLVRSDGQNRSVEVRHDAAPDGGRTVSWPATGEGAAATARNVLRYDAKGRLTEIGGEQDGVASAGFRITHNEQGDIATFTSGSSVHSYEYQYDEAGNWVRRANFRQSGNEARVEDAADWRVFEYLPAPGEPVAASRSPWVRPAKPSLPRKRARAAPAAATAPQPAGDRPPGRPASPAALEGSYTVSRGKTGDPFVVVMKLELRAGNEMRHSIATESPPDRGGRTEKRATGSWSLADGVVTVFLERDDKGVAIPTAQRVLRLRVGGDGSSLVMEHDEQTVFRREGGPPAAEAGAAGGDGLDGGARPAAAPKAPAADGDGLD